MRIVTKLRAFSHTLETTIEANLYRREQELAALMKEVASTPKVYEGYFNQQGSTTFIEKHPNVQFKVLNSQKILKVSSVGIGTYKGSLNEEDDLKMFNGLIDSVLLGCNVIDTCRNFRKGLSQKVIGLALRYLCEHQNCQRNNFFIGSKAGYVFQQLPKGVSSQEVVNDHCVHSTFLRSQLDASLNNLRLTTLDVYYLNNFAQSQMQKLGKKLFEQKLAKAFETLEKVRSEGKIKFYGLSSWQSFRVPEGSSNHLSLSTVMRIAEKVGGKSHGMQFVQVPINIMMPETFADKYSEGKSFLDVAEQFNINVISNSPLLSGTLINVPMPASLLKCDNNGAKHLNLIRSIPSKALVCTLIGHKLNRHVRKNLEVMTAPMLSEEQWLNVFVPKSQPTPLSE